MNRIAFVVATKDRSRGSGPSAYLDYMRGVAALIVFLGHLKLFFYPAYRDLVDPGFLVSASYLVAKLGHAAVMIFFALSGYLVGGSVLRDMRSGRWSWSGYLFKRASRLYVVLIPALLLTAFWDGIGARFFLPVALHGADQVGGNTLISSPFGLAAFASNLLFLQTILAPAYGSNAALWSLSWEWWYYILFPCCLLAARSQRRTAYGLFVVIIVAVVGWEITLYFAIWFAGATIVLWPHQWRKRLNLPVLLSVLTCVLVISAIVANKFTSPALNSASDFAIGLTTVAVIAALLSKDVTSAPHGYSMAFSGLAAISYTLYVVHMPFLWFLRVAFVTTPFSPTFTSLPEFMLIVGLTLLYAYVVWWTTEARTDWVREAIKTIFKPVGLHAEVPAS